MRKAAFIFAQCTWGILQTVAGLIVFVARSRRVAGMFHGTIVAKWASRFSLSLGLFIFLGGDVAEEADTAGSRGARLLVHEYGHAVQSLALGPLYLLVIGLPSLVWARSYALARRRRARGASYYDFYTERWADAWGERICNNRPGR